MQSTARKNELPLDRMCLVCEVTKKNKEEMGLVPREGAFIHGLYMEGARWDVNLGTITESRLKELYPLMPVIHVRAVTQDKQEMRNLYECPVYNTRERGECITNISDIQIRSSVLSGDTYIWTFNLRTKDKPSKWVLAGVALLLQI